MGDAACMDRALDIANRQIDRAPLMVCSAMGGVTDQIVRAYEEAEKGTKNTSIGILEEIKKRHYTTAQNFLSGPCLESAKQELDLLFSQFTALLKGVALLKYCSPRSRDALLSFGERLSTQLIYARSQQRSMKSSLLDARDFMLTEDRKDFARPNREKIFTMTQKLVQPKADYLIITQGFIGSNSAGNTTTLGRGGSDYSASILGATLDAEEIQIWTDVDGMKTCDPRLIPEASTIPEMSYEEAAELAFFGAKVLHPASIQPAVSKDIPVFIRNSRVPEGKGTRIARNTGKTGLKALSMKKNITVLNIISSRMLDAHGFLRQIFIIFDQEETPVDLVSTSEVSVSVTIEKIDSLESIVEELKKIASVVVEKNRAILCLVGNALWQDPHFFSRTFAVLGNVPIRMLSLGASAINLSLVVPEETGDETLRLLHKEFFPAEASGSR